MFLKKFIFSLAVMLVPLSNTLCCNDFKLAVLDIELVMDKSKAGIEAQNKLGRSEKNMKSKLGKELKKAELLKKEIESQDLDKEIIEKRKRALRICLNDLQEMEKKYIKEFDTLADKLMHDLMEDISLNAQKFGNSNNYLTIDKSMLIQYPNRVDVTEAFIEAYDLEYTKNHDS